MREVTVQKYTDNPNVVKTQIESVAKMFDWLPFFANLGHCFNADLQVKVGISLGYMTVGVGSFDTLWRKRNIRNQQ